MKSRKVMIMLEVMSDLPLTTLRRRDWWWTALTKRDSPEHQSRVIVGQVQANVVRPAKKKKAKKQR